MGVGEVVAGGRILPSIGMIRGYIRRVRGDGDWVREIDLLPTARRLVGEGGAGEQAGSGVGRQPAGKTRSIEVGWIVHGRNLVTECSADRAAGRQRAGYSWRGPRLCSGEQDVDPVVIGVVSI